MFEIKLLACTRITEAARKELARAGCPIHKDILWGELENVEIVELQYAGDRDLQLMSVWGVPREIQIRSRELYLHYQWEENENGHEGYVLAVLREDENIATTENTPLANDVDDLDEHPF